MSSTFYFFIYLVNISATDIHSFHHFHSNLSNMIFFSFSFNLLPSGKTKKSLYITNAFLDPIIPVLVVDICLSISISKTKEEGLVSPIPSFFY